MESEDSKVEQSALSIDSLLPGTLDEEAYSKYQEKGSEEKDSVTQEDESIESKTRTESQRTVEGDMVDYFEEAEYKQDAAGVEIELEDQVEEHIMTEKAEKEREPPTVPDKPRWRELFEKPDWIAVWIGMLMILVAVISRLAHYQAQTPLPNSFGAGSGPFETQNGIEILVTVVLLILFATIGYRLTAEIEGRKFVLSLSGIIIIAFLSHIVGKYQRFQDIGIDYAFWSLIFSLIISNTNAGGCPKWLQPACDGEFYIKVGLVLLGVRNIDTIGLVGAPAFIATWVVVPIVYFISYRFVARKLFRMESKSLSLILCAAFSICGSSAATSICTAIKGKREELTLSIAIITIGAIPMMLGMPYLCRAMGLDQVICGAWIGGTVDSTGTVVVASRLAGPVSGTVGSIVKLVQNSSIGFVAVFVTFYWIYKVEHKHSSKRPSFIDIWDRFPKFVLGFILSSILYTFIILKYMGSSAALDVQRLTVGFTRWWFCVGFVCIGLESSIRKLAEKMKGATPIYVYLVGQLVDLLVTIGFVYLAFSGVLLSKPNITAR